MNDAELETKINRAIDILRINEPDGGYGLAFSGGKAEFFEDEFFCRYSVVCTECGARTYTYCVERDAIEAWNWRVEPTFTPDEIDIIARYMRQDFDGNGALERTILNKCNHILKGVK